MITTKEIAEIAAQAANEVISNSPITRRPIHGFYREVVEQGFDGLSDFLRTIAKAPFDTRLKALSEGILPEGGYAVPVQMANLILEEAIEDAVIRPRARIFPMASETLKIPRLVDASHVSHLFGGIIAKWIGEGADKQEVFPEFRQLELKAKKLTGYTYASNELIEDIIGNTLGQLIQSAFAQAISWYEDEAFINGTGVGQPLGILNSPCLISVAPEGGQAATELLAQNVWNMWTRMLPGSGNRTVWLANPTIKPELYSMGVAIGAGGSSIYMPTGGISQSPFDTLMGRPIVWTEHCPVLGTVGDLILADLQYYIIGDRKRLEVAISPHIRFVSDETAWRFVTRVDGQPYFSEPFTPKRGDTLSPFVALETR